MPFVYSTLATSVSCAEYHPQPTDADGKPLRIAAVLKHKVTLKGGAGVADKRLVTPFGVGTEVSEDDLAFLMGHRKFLHWLKEGHMRVTGRKTDPEVVAADMKLRDDVNGPNARPLSGRSAPLTPEDFTTTGAKAPDAARASI